MKRKYNRLLCIILSAVLLLSALPLTVHAAGDTYSVKTPEELKAAVDKINSEGAGEYTISLAADIDSIGGIVIGSIEDDKTDTVVTIIGNGHYLSCPTGQNVQAWNGAKVILGDGETELTLIGGVTNDNPGVVYVIGQDSVCIMNDKVTIKDNQTNNYFGGGVSVLAGSFIMNGGTIENCSVKGGSVCYGGGVAVINGGYFEMNNGTIKNCYVTSYGQNWLYPWVAGGGVFVCRASFTMNGGTIESCTASNFDESSKKDAIGGGIAVVSSLESYYEYDCNWGYLDSNFTMNGGTIKKCSSTIGGGALAAGMAYIYISAMCTQSYGILPGSEDPGIYLNGGSMIENEASAGGAIFLNWIRPNVNIKNMTIDSNYAGEGAAIDVIDKYTHTQIEKCTITNNIAEESGGAILVNDNSESDGTLIKDTTVTDNTSGDRGAGVYYDAASKLYISGANIIQDNTYNGKLNNLNIYMENGTIYPVYVNGDLTGSQIGLSDPTLWDDGKEDADPDAVSTNYLTSGYKANNTANPGTVFTSDHETWIADFSNVNTDEVRLVRKTTVDYHINNQTIADAKYDGQDIFTSYVAESTGEIKIGDTINEFYTVPEVKPTAKNSCPYIFKGWYYDKANDNDENPVDFDTDKYVAGRDIYAHWIEVKDVAKDPRDKYNLPEGETAYGGFDLTGVQVRGAINDTNFDGIRKPGGLRFMTSLSTDVVNEINAIKDNNIEYGYVAATNADWITAHQSHGDKLQYVSKTANGKNTSTYNKENPQDYFGFATNVNCTSQETNASDGIVPQDHRKFSGYLLYTLVITYENGTGYDKNVLARPYIKYTDANGLERVAYSEYRGTNTLGGCYTSYKAILPTP